MEKYDLSHMTMHIVQSHSDDKCNVIQTS